MIIPGISFRLLIDGRKNGIKITQIKGGGGEGGLSSYHP